MPRPRGARGGRGDHGEPLGSRVQNGLMRSDIFFFLSGGSIKIERFFGDFSPTISRLQGGSVGRVHFPSHGCPSSLGCILARGRLRVVSFVLYLTTSIGGFWRFFVKSVVNPLLIELVTACYCYILEYKTVKLPIRRSILTQFLAPRDVSASIFASNSTRWEEGPEASKEENLAGSSSPRSPDRAPR